MNNPCYAVAMVKLKARTKATTDWLDEEEMSAWLNFLNASALLDRRLDQHLKEEAGLSHVQYEVLVKLARSPGGEMRMTQLADAMLTQKSGLTYQVQRLESAGLVKRRPSTSDERGVYAVLTSKGRRRLEQAAPAHVRAVRAWFIDVLSSEQLRVLAEALGEVTRRLQQGQQP